MAIQTKDYLKSKFVQSSRPNQVDFWDLIDSFAQANDPRFAGLSQNSGIPTWSSGQTYGLGAIVIWANAIYQSKINDNAANQPDTTPVAWSAIAGKQQGQGISDYESILEGVLQANDIRFETSIAGTYKLLSEFYDDFLASLASPFEVGMVMQWGGAIAGKFDATGLGINNMIKWALCNGNNNTPNLKGRFIVGYDNTNTDYNSIGNTGGEAKHKLTISELPKFKLKTNLYKDSDDYLDSNSNPNNIGTSPTGSPIYTEEIGGGIEHENRPPFYTMAFIMRIVK